MSEIISCTHKVTLDIAKRDVHMIQVIHGDTANILEVNLCENGKEIPLENATLATITYSNNTFDEMQISEDYKTASVRINANCLKQGLNFAQISIYSGDNGLITADMLTIDCNQKIGGDNPSCPNADMPKLKELINQLIQQGMADGISPEQIADAVADYLAKNPIEETDPNVHEWAKAKEKPTYTAEEVGALSYKTLKPAVDLALAQAKASGEFDGADGKSAYQYAQDGGYTGTEEEFAEKLAAEIPSPYTLPIASPTVLGGVQPVAKTDAMTQSVGVDATGGLWAIPGSGGGGSSQWKIIRDITITENVDRVDISTDDDGNAFSLHEIHVFSYTQSYEDLESPYTFLMNGYWSIDDPYISSGFKSTKSSDTYKQKNHFIATMQNGFADVFQPWKPYILNGSTGNVYSFGEKYQAIKNVSFVGKFVSGCRFVLVGRVG